MAKTTQSVEAENAAFEEANIETLRTAYKLAKEAWKTTPTIDQVMGVVDILDEGVLEDMVVPLLIPAISEAKKYVITETSGIFEIFDAMMNDDYFDDHMVRTVKVAEEVFGPKPSGDVILGVYFQIFGEREEDEDGDE